jgi:small redox-active disulfide protein 2
MTQLQVLGPGCASCTRLAELTREVADELGLDYELEKVADLNVIAGYGMVRTPALVIDGRIVMSGRVPSPAELRTLLAAPTGR